MKWPDVPTLYLLCETYDEQLEADTPSSLRLPLTPDVLGRVMRLHRAAVTLTRAGVVVFGLEAEEEEIRVCLFTVFNGFIEPDGSPVYPPSVPLSRGSETPGVYMGVTLTSEDPHDPDPAQQGQHVDLTRRGVRVSAEELWLIGETKDEHTPVCSEAIRLADLYAALEIGAPI